MRRGVVRMLLWFCSRSWTMVPGWGAVRCVRVCVWGGTISTKRQSIKLSERQPRWMFLILLETEKKRKFYVMRQNESAADASVTTWGYTNTNTNTNTTNTNTNTNIKRLPWELFQLNMVLHCQQNDWILENFLMVFLDNNISFSNIIYLRSCFKKKHYSWKNRNKKEKKKNWPVCPVHVKYVHAKMVQTCFNIQL